MIQSINPISITLIEELKNALKKDTIYDSEQSMEVKIDNLPGLTSSTKPHSAPNRHVDPPYWFSSKAWNQNQNRKGKWRIENQNF